MLAAVGQVLPVAVAIAVSSVPIVIVVLIVVTGTTAGADLAFLTGWLAGLTLVGGLVVAFADALVADASQPRWANALRIVLGVVLLWLAARQWRHRADDPDAAGPTWMQTLDTLTAGRALGLGFALGSLNPKNALLMVSGAASILSATAVVHEQVVALAVLVVGGSVGVAAPVVAHRVFGAQVTGALESAKAWLTDRHAEVMAVVLLVLGAVLLGNGLAGLG